MASSGGPEGGPSGIGAMAFLSSEYRGTLVTAFCLAASVSFGPGPLSGQVHVDVAYGVDRNVASAAAEADGWLSVVAELRVGEGVGLGLGFDQQFDGPRPGLSEYESGALYLFSSYHLSGSGPSPFVRAGIGLGPAPCVSDTCGAGLHVRGSIGLRVPISGRLGLLGEVGMSRVSRPFGGVGVSLSL